MLSIPSRLNGLSRGPSKPRAVSGVEESGQLEKLLETLDKSRNRCSRVRGAQSSIWTGKISSNVLDL